MVDNFENSTKDYEDAIVWLENKDEQKSDKVEPKFKVGDYIERKDGLGCRARIIFVGGNVYGCEKIIHSEDSSPFFEFMFKNQDEFQISPDFKQKPTDNQFTPEQANVLDKPIEQNTAWSEEDECHRLDVNSAVDEYFDEGYAEKLRGWLESIKNRVQPKVELSQLDKNILEAAIAFVRWNNYFNCWGGVDKDAVLSALYSLKH